MQSQQSLLEKLHSETAKMSWQELQPFFARGSVLHVSDSLDLIEVAMQFAQDQTESLRPQLEAGHIAAPSNEMARRWYQTEAVLWTVVVAPFVLVQNESVEI